MRKSWALAGFSYRKTPRISSPRRRELFRRIENERWIADPEALLAELKGIERACGRVDRGRYGPRELDLDILLFSSMPAVIELPALEVPHPRLRERRFALEPLAEVAPDERDPASRRTVRELLDDVRDQDAEKVAGAEWWTPA